MPTQIDSIDVNIPCPNCGLQNNITLGQITREESIKCLGCGITINLKDKKGSAKKGINEVQKALDKLGRTLKKLGLSYSLFRHDK